MSRRSWFLELPDRSVLTGHQRDVVDELHAMLDHLDPAGFDPADARARLTDGALSLTMRHVTAELALSIVVGEAAEVTLQVEEAPPRLWRIGPDDKAEAVEPWPSRTVDLVAGITNGTIEREDSGWGTLRLASSIWLRTDDGNRHLLAGPAGVRRLLRYAGFRAKRSFGFGRRDG